MDGGEQIKKTVKGVSIPLTDANVVAYNPYLSLKYNAHINVGLDLSTAWNTSTSTS